MSNTRRSQQSKSDRMRDLAAVSLVLSGDENTFAEVYNAYSRRVYAFILRRVRDAAEAEDLTQETFVQLYQSLDSFEGRSSLLTFTFGIAHNVCRHYFRQCSRWMVDPKNARPLAERPVACTIERRVEAARILARCERVLEASLRPTHREIFRLRYRESHSIRAIAEKMGKTNEAIKVSLRRSRAALMDDVPELSVVLENIAQSA